MRHDGEWFTRQTFSGKWELWQQHEGREHLIGIVYSEVAAKFFVEKLNEPSVDYLLDHPDYLKKLKRARKKAARRQGA